MEHSTKRRKPGISGSAVAVFRIGVHQIANRLRLLWIESRRLFELAYCVRVLGLVQMRHSEQVSSIEEVRVRSDDTPQALDPGFRDGRPPVWPLAVMEWAVFFASLLWFAVIGLAGRNAARRAG